VGALESISGLAFPHAAKARVLGSVEVRAAEVKVSGLREARVVTAIDFDGLEQEMAPESWTDSLQADLAAAVSTRPVEDGPMPASLRTALAARGYDGPAAGAAESVRWQRMQVEVVLVSPGPLGEPMFVLVTREPFRWLGTIAREVRDRDGRPRLLRGKKAKTPAWIVREAPAAALVMAVGGILAAFWGLMSSRFDSGSVALCALGASMLALAFYLNGYRLGTWRGGARDGCACRACETRRDRGAALLAGAGGGLRDEDDLDAALDAGWMAEARPGGPTGATGAADAAGAPAGARVRVAESPEDDPAEREDAAASGATAEHDGGAGRRAAAGR
jgi:hypothetical protein